MARSRKSDAITRRSRGDLDLPRLCRAVRDARTELRDFRQTRKDAIETYAGPRYNPSRFQPAKPLNLIDLYVRVVSRQLVAKNPRVMLSTFARKAAATVAAMERWVNREIERQNLAAVLSDCVYDALFGFGIMKVALATPADAAVSGWNMTAGQPYACSIDFDDWVHDYRASRVCDGTFMGHRFRVPLDAIKDSRIYSAARRTLERDADNPYDLDGIERVDRIGRWRSMSDVELEDHIDVWEIYLPRRRLVVTIADQQLQADGGLAAAEPLRAVEWLGPDSGPYHYLGLGRVPGNAVPKPPVLDLLDLDDAVNTVWRKLIRQARRQKEILASSGGATESAQRVRDAADGEIVDVDNPERLKTVLFGGPSAANFQFGMNLREQFSYAAGNLDAMGGLAPQARTASQDKMLAANSSQMIAEMGDATLAFVTSGLSALCWYWWNHPEAVYAAEATAGPGLPDIRAVQRVHPAGTPDAALVRDLPWEELSLEVDPYSMQHSTPQQRLANLAAFVQQTYIPLAPLFAQQGVYLDLSRYAEKVAALSDMPDLPDILSIQEPLPNGAGGSPDQSGPGPGSTTRNYVRESVSAPPSQEDRAAEVMSQMRGMQQAAGGGGVMNQAG